VVNARALPMGDRAILLEVPSLDDVLALHASLKATRPAGVTDIVPAARTVLIRVDPVVLTFEPHPTPNSVSSDAKANVPKRQWPSCIILGRPLGVSGGSSPGV